MFTFVFKQKLGNKMEAFVLKQKFDSFNFFTDVSQTARCRPLVYADKPQNIHI